MSKKKKTEEPGELPSSPGKPEIEPGSPAEPFPGEEPEITPAPDPGESSPAEIPVPGKETT